MSDHSDTVWDEYQWERFLQQQEKRTEKYMELLEKYIDHPQCDEIIAKEMNWPHLLEEGHREWEEEVDAAFDEEVAGMERIGGEGEPEEPPYSFENHPLYRLAFEFSAELGTIFEALPPKALDHPAAVALQTGVTTAAQKLAAALSDGDEAEDLGMCIAYLKRALHAITGGLNATTKLEGAKILDPARAAHVRAMLFSIRDGIVTKTGECRAEFRRRHGR